MHLLVLNRWDDEFSTYQQYFDHKDHDVSYISNTSGIQINLDKNVFRFNLIDDLSDQSKIVDIAHSINSSKKIDRVIAMSEFDLDAAATIRESFRIPGHNIKTNALYRDKVVMKEYLCRRGIRVPIFKKVESEKEAKCFAQEYGLPVVMKPIMGAASKGVRIVRSINDFPSFDPKDEFEVEQYIEGSIYHIDGIYRDRKSIYSKISRYINNCLSFRDGYPLGSVTEDCREKVKDINDFTDSILKALDFQTGAFHLEIIQADDGLVFLEIGGRVGGGEIPFVAKHIENIDLYDLWAKAITGYKIAPTNQKLTAFLMIPRSPKIENYNKIVLSNRHIRFQNTLSQEECSSDFSYEKIPARVHFSAETSDELEAAVRDTAIEYLVAQGIPRQHTSAFFLESL